MHGKMCGNNTAPQIVMSHVPPPPRKTDQHFAQSSIVPAQKLHEWLIDTQPQDRYMCIDKTHCQYISPNTSIEKNTCIRCIENTRDRYMSLNLNKNTVKKSTQNVCARYMCIDKRVRSRATWSETKNRYTCITARQEHIGLNENFDRNSWDRRSLLCVLCVCVCALCLIWICRELSQNHYLVKYSSLWVGDMQGSAESWFRA